MQKAQKTVPIIHDYSMSASKNSYKHLVILIILQDRNYMNIPKPQATTDYATKME